MNLTKMFEMQKKLRQVGLFNYRGPDRFDKLVLALLTELGELANEWRGFKFWSKNQKPNDSILTSAGAYEGNAQKYVCGNGECGESFIADDPNLKDMFGMVREDCPECETGCLFPMRHKNPLLEEFVDGKHFLLELGIELDVRAEQIEKYIGKQKKLIGSVEYHFGYLYNRVSELMDTGSLEDKRFKLLQIFNAYIGLGYRLGFTWEQIEEAYMVKNAINHQRQESGY